MINDEHIHLAELFQLIAALTDKFEAETIRQEAKVQLLEAKLEMQEAEITSQAAKLEIQEAEITRQATELATLKVTYC